jgi:hypothetical protein
MKGRISSPVCAAFVLATGIAVLAQAQTSPQTSPAQSAAKSVTVTGCVQRAEEGATGTTGTTGGATRTKFILAKASIKPDQMAGTTGTTAAPPATAIASEYKLDTDESKVSAHVGHKVEVTGEIEQPSMSEQKPPASAANAPTLKVDTVKMVAATCQ